MFENGKIRIAGTDKKIYLLPEMANRHGVIAGATGTGKTVTMKVLAESFSDMGVPVFFADVKGDLSGTCLPGKDSEDMEERIKRFGLEGFTFKGFPTRFWDIYGEAGHPVRITVSDMGPMLLARLLGLTDVQAGVLNVVFRVADDQGLLLLDLKDLRAMLKFVGDNRAEFTTDYGNVTTASIGAIQRALLAFEEEGGESIFGEPALDITDFMRTDVDGRGYINVLNSTKLIQSPTVYATFLLWMMTELFERLPEVGDLPKPRMIFFFDEAHLLFDDAPKALVGKIVQVVKLIRSKGVGIYFISQSASDIPDDVLAQLSNRIQHALRAYTPSEQKSLKATADAFRTNPDFNTREALTELGVGEALVSFLDEKGVPTVVERAFILPPQSLIGPADEETVKSLILADEFDLKYRQTVDRESAFEIIEKANEALAAEEEQAAAEEAKEKKKSSNKTEEFLLKKAAKRAASSATSTAARAVSTNIVNSIVGGKKVSAGTIAKRAATNALSSVMRTGTSSILRGIFGNRK
ncbi:MAG: DUF853 domain-containing protein [Clostridia bacterium]|nr:DUF853 domain-containing protein [Clostridia bacterium]